MSKDEVYGFDCSEDKTIKIKIILEDTSITNRDFYINNRYNIQILQNLTGSHYINGEIDVDIDTINYSKFLKTIHQNDPETKEYRLSSEHITAETFTWFILFTKLFKTKEEHFNPPKPAEHNIIEGFTRNKYSQNKSYNQDEVAFYTTLDKNIPLLIKLLDTSNYLDCPILMYNCAYVLASYIRRTPSLEIIEHFKDNGILDKNTIITNQGCEDCDDEPIPEYH